MSRIFNSFEEVDKDLKILNLKREIAIERMKGDVEDVKDRFRPPEVLSLLNSGTLRKVLISWAFGYLLKRLRK